MTDHTFTYSKFAGQRSVRCSCGWTFRAPTRNALGAEAAIRGATAKHLKTEKPGGTSK